MPRYRSILLAGLIFVSGVAFAIAADIAAESTPNLAYSAGTFIGAFVAVLFLGALVVIPAVGGLWLVVSVVRHIQGRRYPAGDQTDQPTGH